MLLNILYLVPDKWWNYSKNINTDNIFGIVHHRNSLQQAPITWLIETMFDVSNVRTNDQQWLRPLANGTDD